MPIKSYLIQKNLSQDARGGHPRLKKGDVRCSFPFLAAASKDSDWVQIELNVWSEIARVHAIKQYSSIFFVFTCSNFHASQQHDPFFLHQKKKQQHDPLCFCFPWSKLAAQHRICHNRNGHSSVVKKKKKWTF